MDDTSSNPVDTTTSVIQNIKEWAKLPFSTTMDLSRWFLFTGLIVVAIIIWLLIYHEVIKEV